MAEDAIAKARAIAAKLSGGIMGTELGKRKNRFDGEENASGAGLGLLKKKKVYIPVRDHPDINFLGLLIGPRGATQKQLQEASGAKILIRGKGSQKEGAPPTGHPDDEDELHVSIEGSDEAIEKALKEVEQILFNPQQAMRLKQEQLRNLAEMNGSSVPGSAPPAGGDSIYGAGRDNADEGSYQIELRVPNNMVGLIIGKGGENIQRMQSQTGSHVQIAKESDMKPGETLRSIVLKGTPDGVAECKRRVDEIIESRMQPPQQMSRGPPQQQNRELDHAFVMKVPVPNDKVGIIIGRGGMTVKSIQERTRAMIQIPPGPDEDNPSLRTLSIGGDTKESIEAAHMEIGTVLQQHSMQSQQQAAQSTSLYITVPDDKVGVIIGKGGITIKDIQNRLRVRIQIPQQSDPGSNPPLRTCSIMGSPEAQQAARYEIETVLQNHAMGLNTNIMSTANQFGGGGGGGYGGGNQWGQPQQQQYGGQQAPYYGQQQQHQQYGAAQQPYAAQQAYPSYGGYADPNAMAAAAQATGYAVDPNAGAAAAAAAAAVDPSAYYNDFWAYATYYGEAAARTYYGAWSPPEGTPPPPGVIVPDPATAAAAIAAATGGAPPATGDAGQGGQEQLQQQQEQLQAVPSAADAGGAGAVSGDGDASSVAAEAATWEAYKKQYAEWYEAHGRALGADPNPPPPQS